MAGIRTLHVVVGGLILLSSPAFVSSARGQTIAYEPQIGFIPSGATMTVVPAVSADRRYVRLSVNAFFNELNSLQTFSFPGGAVSGGGAFGGFGGMNGVMGGGGGGGAVGGGVGAVGGAGVAMDPGMQGAAYPGYAAGPMPLGAEFGEFFPAFLGDPLMDPRGAGEPGLLQEAGEAAEQGMPAAAGAAARGPQGARAAKHPGTRQRSKAARKSSRRPAVKSRRTSR